MKELGERGIACGFLKKFYCFSLGPDHGGGFFFNMENNGAV